jgi:hypothetical protein
MGSIAAPSTSMAPALAPISFGAPVLDIKLNGQNYREWAFSLKMLLQAVGLALHLTDDPPDADDKDAKAWRLNDGRVMTTICMSIDQDIWTCLEEHTTAKEMWDYLKGKYQQSSSVLRHSIRQRLHHLQQQDMSVDEYHTAFTKLHSQLDSMVPKPSSFCKNCAASWAARDKYEQQNTMFDFVMGLRLEFEPLRVQLLGRPTLPTLSEAVSALIAEETRLRTLAAPSIVPQHSVLAAPPHK